MFVNPSMSDFCVLLKFCAFPNISFNMHLLPYLFLLYPIGRPGSILELEQHRTCLAYIEISDVLESCECTSVIEYRLHLFWYPVLFSYTAVKIEK